MTIVAFIVFIVMCLALKASGVPHRVASRIMFGVIFLTCILGGWGP